MTLAALDFTSDRVWALSGATGQTPQVIPLGGGCPELPLALTDAGRRVEVGRMALRQVRRAPHRVCRNFLPRLGQACEWQVGPHRLSPEAALRVVLARLRPHLVGCRCIAVGLPAYLSRAQVHLLGRLAMEAGLPVLGAIPRSTATAWAAYRTCAMPSVGVVADVDEHALTCCVLEARDGELICRHRRVLTGLGLRVWRERLIRCVAETCIRVCRRDPREAPEADQSVFDQIDEVMDQCAQSQRAVVRVQAVEWFQELTIEPEQAAAACAPLAGQAAELIWSCLLLADAGKEEPRVWFTAATAQLPGLAARFYARSGEQLPISVISSAALGQAVHALARQIDSGQLAPGYFDPALLLATQGPEAEANSVTFPSYVAARGR